jgi:hypothetical protein
MPANEGMAFKRPGEDLTFKATAAVTGKRFVKVSGNRTGGGAGGLSTDLANVYQMQQSGAGEQAVGVSKYDVANGSLGGCYTAGIVSVTAGATLTAGQAVESSATGAAVPLSTGVKLGVVMTGCASAGEAEILLNLG